MEQAQRGGTEERSAILFSALRKNVEQAFDVEQPEDVEQPKDVEQAQRGGIGPKINHTCSLAHLASLGET